MDDQLLGRLRTLFDGRADVVEKRMVGGRSFLVDGRMCCGVTKGGLMVRVGVQGRDAALAEPHVQPLMMGAKVVEAYVVVAADAVADDDDLTRWVRRGEES
ncbi:TfoX/Sxy family protein [Pseudonocardia sulfidoxydans]|uniref:TfoX/Sxy family protein n=1 Tax=Pseudonocardia sulfidoxydans TaxID=54011 RepID=UPI0011BE3584|nr:TfoX/Sxy family protein [Pseudonocardia sulfidoxydans]